MADNDEADFTNPIGIAHRDRIDALPDEILETATRASQYLKSGNYSAAAAAAQVALALEAALAVEFRLPLRDG